MNVSLTKEQISYIEGKVASGGYQTASEVVRESLRLMKERDIIQGARLEAIRKGLTPEDVLLRQALADKPRE